MRYIHSMLVLSATILCKSVAGGGGVGGFGRTPLPPDCGHELSALGS